MKNGDIGNRGSRGDGAVAGVAASGDCCGFGRGKGDGAGGGGCPRAGRAGAKAAALALVLAGALAASGCTLLPESQPLVVYQLPATVAAPGSMPSVAGATARPAMPARAGIAGPDLRVAMPEGNGLVSTTRILVLPRGNEVSAYAGARWVDAAPRLLRDRLARELRAGGGLASVSVNGQSLADLELTSELGAFQVEYGHDGLAPAVRIAMDAALVHPGASRIVATRRFEIVRRVTGADVSQAVEAFGHASDELARQVNEWVLAQVAAQR